jgi:hypothetical protein
VSSQAESAKFCIPKFVVRSTKNPPKTSALSA